MMETDQIAGSAPSVVPAPLTTSLLPSGNHATRLMLPKSGARNSVRLSCFAQPQVNADLIGIHHVPAVGRDG